MTREGRSQEAREALAEILQEINETSEPLKQAVRAGGEKLSREEAQEATRTALPKRVLLWHGQVPNIIKRITGKVDGSSQLHKIFVDGFRRSETRMNRQKHDIIEGLETAAKDAGFSSLAEASMKMDGAHGLGLSSKLIKVTLGVQTVRLLPGEVLHLALMDPQTRASIENGSPLMVHRAKKSAKRFENVTLEELDAAAAKLDPRIIKFGN